MKTYEVVGYKHAVGEYNGTHYDNMNLYCAVHDDSAKDITGATVATIKCKYDSFPKDLGLAVGQMLNIYFDEYGRPVYFSDIVE